MRGKYDRILEGIAGCLLIWLGTKSEALGIRLESWSLLASLLDLHSQIYKRGTAQMKKKVDMNEVEKELIKQSEEAPDLSVLEETGIAFNPQNQHLGLSIQERRRTTSLMMAIQAYQHLIIKEADYLREASNLASNGRGPALRPATIDAMVEAAWKFDLFIAGIYPQLADETAGGVQVEESAEANTEANQPT